MKIPIDPSLTQEEKLAEVNKRRDVQEELCKQEKIPRFAPSGGICFSCGRQIYTVEDGTTHITGCPHFSRSYVD